MSLKDLQESAKAGKLLVVCGAGTSSALSAHSPNWTSLIGSGLRYALARQLLSTEQHQRYEGSLESKDQDDLIGAAQFLLRKMGGREGLNYGRWLEEEFSALKPSNPEMGEAISILTARGVPLCTLNYDTLLEAVTGLQPITVNDRPSVTRWFRKEQPGILHLHGIWSAPSTCVFGVSDYEDAVSDPFRSQLQQSIASFSRILFIGCGGTLSDPNLSSMVRWVKNNVGLGALKHYVAVRSQDSQRILSDPLYQGFADPISYGDAYAELPTFLQTIASSCSSVARRAVTAEPEVIESYRAFLVRDCGQMTMEGIAADAETAKQKFDLEKLFVPLQVQAAPPDIPQSDKKREEKLRKWQEENSDPMPFGDALTKHGRIALLALPGGGKTLLLKRLAVAFADKSRRERTDDHLPTTDLLPILIRCREWRDHIRLPIPTMVRRFSEITGEQALEGFFESASARLKSGKVLLLIDGLDEIHNDADRSTFVDHLETFLTEHPKIKVVITSREAGFSLVAPNISRFCTRFTISPLDSYSIRLLCQYWHKLMVGDSPEADEDADNVSTSILINAALRRLAENPLLLTMLLVVKHGNGKLPPDRVTLYDRAVETLLDTWNIKGHDALSLREAVPQLAYVAFKMMVDGKQTATKKELLNMLVECRTRLEMMKWYVQDTPEEFLRRVELRSSLLLEGGRISQRGKAVPFYQFRHLTFQEYLAAVAAVEGHFDGYEKAKSAADPLGPYLLATEWKEVIPMAAVLAKKNSGPLIQDLISEGLLAEAAAIASEFAETEDTANEGYTPPNAVARLNACLLEEVEFSAGALSDTLRLVVLFAHGCIGQGSWAALAQGTFGGGLVDEAWRIYLHGELSERAARQSWIRNTVCLLSAHRAGDAEYRSANLTRSLAAALRSRDDMVVAHAAAKICGWLWIKRAAAGKRFKKLLPLLEKNLRTDNAKFYEIVAWAIGGIAYRSEHDIDFNSKNLSDAGLQLVVDRWCSAEASDLGSIDDFLLSRCLLFYKGMWKPVLNEESRGKIKKLVLDGPRPDDIEQRNRYETGVLLAYHDQKLMQDVGFDRLSEQIRVKGGVSGRFRELLDI